jgi:hypothetical protein
MGREYSAHEERRNAYRVLLRKAGGKRSLQRPTCRCQDNIKMDLREIGWSNMDLIKLVLNRTSGKFL